MEARYESHDPPVHLPGFEHPLRRFPSGEPFTPAYLALGREEQARHMRAAYLETLREAPDILSI